MDEVHYILKLIAEQQRWYEERQESCILLGVRDSAIHYGGAIVALENLAAKIEEEVQGVGFSG